MAPLVLSGIDPASLRPLFDLDDAGLAAHHAVRHIADSARGFPCRVSLRDAAVGEELLLVSYRHPPAASPYRVCAPVFIRRGAMPARLAANEVPPHVAHRLLSVRACDPADCRGAAEVREGVQVGAWLGSQLDDPGIAQAHLHSARHGGCLCHAGRAGADPRTQLRWNIALASSTMPSMWQKTLRWMRRKRRSMRGP
ncbi:DUF1203 domain-containing protein [Stenotrophomonas sp. Y6]|uniref:DUF1203 domain-containing protein n=1 Tax=Stenotrophomonas sp. Y6 TaxID=2920383 RepID=UPI001F05B9B9|nr:DUF1203 domain-containing protein [Stenotrophomonas sp. Y6]MCH1910185.1 DUF1203 domain-containing protein [Stenotrophomonas sp. Y6]